MSLFFQKKSQRESILASAMRTEPFNRSTLPPVTCPGCRVRMAPVVINSLPADRVDITYRCDKCGTETDRVIRVRSQWHSSRGRGL